MAVAGYYFVRWVPVPVPLPVPVPVPFPVPVPLPRPPWARLSSSALRVRMLWRRSASLFFAFMVFSSRLSLPRVGRVHR